MANKSAFESSWRTTTESKSKQTNSQTAIINFMNSKKSEINYIYIIYT